MKCQLDGFIEFACNNTQIGEIQKWKFNTYMSTSPFVAKDIRTRSRMSFCVHTHN